jgi:hypothetical protein
VDRSQDQGKEILEEDFTKDVGITGAAVESELKRLFAKAL